MIDRKTAPGDAAYARDANYWPGKGECCLDGTRNRVLEEIRRWVEDESSPVVYWLDGLIGTGKTAIARTVVKELYEDHRVVVSFFCSRQEADLSNPKLIIPTLAIQMAHALKQTNPELSSEVGWLFYNDVEFAFVHKSFDSQMSDFIGLKRTGAPDTKVVIVIDGLGECEDDDLVSQFLSALVKSESEIRQYNLKFFITSHPLVWKSRQAFLRLRGVATVAPFALHEVEPEEMQLFLKRGLLEHELTQSELNMLSEHVGGFFPYATQAVNFIRNESKPPREQLYLLLTSRKKIYLDSLYVPIFEEVIWRGESLELIERICSVLGTVSLAMCPISPSTIAWLLNLDVVQVRGCLNACKTLFILQGNEPVRPVHHSLTDLLTNRRLHSTDERFRVDLPALHKKLLIGCMRLMIKPPGDEDGFGEALEYAWKSVRRHCDGAIGTGDWDAFVSNSGPEEAKLLRPFGQLFLGKDE